jgi:alpha-ketoglutarate-dependent taurine dioxygenase
VYDRLSPTMQKMLEGCTALHDAQFFADIARAHGREPVTTPRGHPENSGPKFQAIHPVIRTNPITGWKSVFVNQHFTKKILNLSQDEGEVVLKYLLSLVSQNHDLQVRYRWDKYVSLSSSSTGH